MDLNIDSKKKKDKMEAFFQDNDEHALTNDFSGVDQMHSFNDDKEYRTLDLKEDVNDTERKIDALVLGKRTSIDEAINKQKISPETNKIDNMPYQNFEINQDRSPNESCDKPYTRPPPLAERKDNEKIDYFQLSTNTEDLPLQKLKKPISIPKVRVRINNERFDHKDSKKPNRNDKPFVKISETTDVIEDTINRDDKRENIPSQPKKKWFRSGKEKSLDTEKSNIKIKQTMEKKSRPFLEKKDITNHIPNVEESKENDSDRTKQGKHSTFEHEEPVIDEEVRKLLAITNELLGKLPEEAITEFALSDDFVLYEKIMNKYHIK